VVTLVGDTCVHPANASNANAPAKQRCRDNPCGKLGTMRLIALPRCGFEFAGGQLSKRTLRLAVVTLTGEQDELLNGVNSF